MKPLLSARLRQAWRQRRGVMVAAGVLVAVLTVVGAGLAVLWWWWGPQLDIIASPRGALVANEQPEEYISSDGRFGLIVGVTGVVAGLAAWLARRFRGPELLLALALGAFAGSLVMWQLGEEIGTVHGQDIVDAMVMGESGQVPIVELHATGLLFLQPLLAVLTYVVCVSWSSTPDLRSTPAVLPPVGPGRESVTATDNTPAQVK